MATDVATLFLALWIAGAAAPPAGRAGVLAALLAGAGVAWIGVFALHGLYRPLHATAATRALGAELVLRLTIDDSSWTSQQRRWTPLIPDHGHVVHLFLVRDQDLGGFAHLHPLPRDSATFEASLPPLPAGRYRVYADIVHESGFAQTLVAMAEIGSPATGE